MKKIALKLLLLYGLWYKLEVYSIHCNSVQSVKILSIIWIYLLKSEAFLLISMFFFSSLISRYYCSFFPSYFRLWFVFVFLVGVVVVMMSIFCGYCCHPRVNCCQHLARWDGRGQGRKAAGWRIRWCREGELWAENWCER